VICPRPSPYRGAPVMDQPDPAEAVRMLEPDVGFLRQQGGVGRSTLNHGRGARNILSTNAADSSLAID
jgi:hypothetical protein